MFCFGRFLLSFRIYLFILFYLVFSSFGWWFLKDSPSISTACRHAPNYLLLLFLLFLNLGKGLNLNKKRTSHSHTRNPGTPPRNCRVPGLLEWAASEEALLWSPDSLWERQGQLKINLKVIKPQVRQAAHGAFNKNVNVQWRDLHRILSSAFE